MFVNFHRSNFIDLSQNELNENMKKKHHNGHLMIERTNGKFREKEKQNICRQFINFFFSFFFVISSLKQ